MTRQLAEWGFTAVRLGAMWTGVEPEEEGSVNETYVEVLKEIVEGLGSQGVYTYLDMHQVCRSVLVWLESKYDPIPQDVLTGVDGYWGIPPWLHAKMTPPSHPFPWPMKDKVKSCNLLHVEDDKDNLRQN